jgi:hypothetical protein
MDVPNVRQWNKNLRELPFISTTFMSQRSGHELHQHETKRVDTLHKQPTEQNTWKRITSMMLSLDTRQVKSETGIT